MRYIYTYIQFKLIISSKILVRGISHRVYIIQLQNQNLRKRASKQLVILLDHQAIARMIQTRSTKLRRGQEFRNFDLRLYRMISLS